MTKNKKTEIAEAPNNALATPIDFGADAKAGADFGMDEILIPFIGLLQKDSKECIEGEEKYIAGAEAGMFVNKSTQDLIDGKEGLRLGVAMRQTTYVEWTDGGGGSGEFVDVHPIGSPIVAEARARNGGKERGMTTEAGNLLQLTYSLFCVVLSDDDTPTPQWVVVSFDRSKIKRYKTFVTKIKGAVALKNAPIFAHRVRLTSVDDKNKAGNRYKNFLLEPLVAGEDGKPNPVSSHVSSGHPVYEAAKALHNALDTGAAKADYSTVDAGPDGGETDRESEDGAF